MFSVLLLFGFVSAAVGLPGPVGISEGLPAGQVEDYFDNLAFTVQQGFKDPVPIEDLDWGIDHLFGIPFTFKVTTKNGQIAPSTDIKRTAEVTGIQEMSGTAHIQGTLNLGKVVVTYDDISINIFGLVIGGPAEVRLHETSAPVNLQIYKNAMTQRKTVASVNELNGFVSVNFGSDSFFQKVCNGILDFLFNMPPLKDIFVWAFFEDVISYIEKEIGKAAVAL